MKLTLTLDLHDLCKLVLNDENHAEILGKIHTDLIERFTNDLKVIESFCEERLELGEGYELRYDELRETWRDYTYSTKAIVLYDWWAKDITKFIVGNYNLKTNETKDVMRFRVLGIRILPEHNPYQKS